jgi:hypothetical protein
VPFIYLGPDRLVLTQTPRPLTLNLNRTHLYYQPLPPSPEELALKRRIDKLYTAYPFYGSRKIAAVLKLNRKRLQGNMRVLARRDP